MKISLLEPVCVPATNKSRASVHVKSQKITLLSSRPVLSKLKASLSHPYQTQSSGRCKQKALLLCEDWRVFEFLRAEQFPLVVGS